MKPGAARVKYGLAKEEQLKPTLERVLRCPITKTTNPSALFDFESATHNIELKSRTYRPEAFNTWLLPHCKVEGARASPKKSLFFYYFEPDQSLYKIEYVEELFDTFETTTPWHTKQLHVLIPAVLFTKITA
jgi:hypothetical protein